MSKSHADCSNTDTRKSNLSSLLSRFSNLQNSSSKTVSRTKSRTNSAGFPRRTRAGACSLPTTGAVKACSGSKTSQHQHIRTDTQFVFSNLAEILRFLWWTLFSIPRLRSGAPPSLVEGVPAHCRGLGQDELLSPPQHKPFCDSVILSTDGTGHGSQNKQAVHILCVSFSQKPTDDQLKALLAFPKEYF